MDSSGPLSCIVRDENLLPVRFGERETIDCGGVFFCGILRNKAQQEAADVEYRAVLVTRA